MSSPRCVIGIDLGTTQCALAWYDREHPSRGVQVLDIPQLVARGQIEARPTLPSLLYLADGGERGIEVPWTAPGGILQTPGVVGTFARELGFGVPTRLVHSAKSWLCHPRVDSTAPILPWQSEAVTDRISPVQAATCFLRHLIAVWNHTMAGHDPGLAFDRQKIIVTVPASFDPAARNLTLQAIAEAGIPEVTLLEEPQAAFYDYLARNPKRMRTDLRDTRTVLVVDIGGGTTDFSLIGVEWPSGQEEPTFSRLAVGPHLLIGGDNFDLALARQVEGIFRHQGRKLVAKQWQALLAQSRIAKEQVLAGEMPDGTPPGKLRFSLPGAGSQVIAKNLSAEVTAEEIRQLLLDGYFPTVSADDRPADETALGLSEAGLPYTREPAITKHLAAFLGENGVQPDTVLFNGGTLLSALLRDRLVEILTGWRGGTPPRVLANPHPTLAVAAGAVQYGLVALNLGQKIKSGTPVSLYVGIGTGKTATASHYVPEQLLCVLPKGSDAEQDYDMAGKSLGVDVSRDVAFYLYYTPTPPKGEALGEVIRFNAKKFGPLPPLKMAGTGGKGIVQVRLKARLRETGYLQLVCHGTAEGSPGGGESPAGAMEGAPRPEGSPGGGVGTLRESPAGRPSAGATGGAVSRRSAPRPEEFSRELAFEIRPAEAANSPESVSGKRGPAIGKRQVTQIGRLFDALFAPPPDTIAFNLLFKELESIIGEPRDQWDLPTLRTLFDTAVDDERFATSEDAWVARFRLLGYCARPGFGSAEDPGRIARLWKWVDQPFTPRNAAFWSEWWLLWKRVAPGLDEDRQMGLVRRIEPLLFPPKKFEKGQRQADQHERNALWRLLGQLERIPAKEKERLGWWIVRAPASFGRDLMALYALGRLGARVLSYAPLMDLVSQGAVNEWLDILLRHGQNGGSYLEWALRELGRKTGDRLVQADEKWRKLIVDLLRKKNRKKTFLAPLLEVQALEAEDYAEFCGEALPSGFVWVK